LMICTNIGRIRGGDSITAIALDAGTSFPLYRHSEEVLRMANLCRG
jgi:hypothetical protein